jgi:hypothetical protein
MFSREPVAKNRWLTKFNRRHHPRPNTPSPKPTFPVPPRAAEVVLLLPRLDATGVFRFLDAKSKYGDGISVAFQLPSGTSIEVLDISLGEPYWKITYLLAGQSDVRELLKPAPSSNVMHIAGRRAADNPLTEVSINRLQKSA